MVNVDVPARPVAGRRARRTAACGRRGRFGAVDVVARRVGRAVDPVRSRVGRSVGRAQRSGSGSCAGAGIGRRPVRAGVWLRTEVGQRPSGRRRGGGAGRRGAAGRRSGRWPHGLRQGLDGGGRDLPALEVLAAPGAQRPVHPDQPAAVRADAVQPGPAGRADDPFVVDPSLAGRAVVDRLDLGEEGLLGQVPLPDLADLLVRPDDLVDPDGEDEEDRGEQDDPGRGDVRQDRVVRPLLHVAERPVGRRQPEDDQVEPDRPEAELDDVALEDVAERRRRSG